MRQSSARRPLRVTTTRAAVGGRLGGDAVQAAPRGSGGSARARRRRRSASSGSPPRAAGLRAEHAAVEVGDEDRLERGSRSGRMPCGAVGGRRRAAGAQRQQDSRRRPAAPRERGRHRRPSRSRARVSVEASSSAPASGEHRAGPQVAAGRRACACRPCPAPARPPRCAAQLSASRRRSTIGNVNDA